MAGYDLLNLIILILIAQNNLQSATASRGYHRFIPPLCTSASYRLFVPPLRTACVYLKALTSLITRSLLTPVELAASATGASLRSLFLHVPLQWQAVVMLQLILLTTLVTLMLCRYKVIIPWVVRLEPHTRPAHTSAVSADTARAHKSICG